MEDSQRKQVESSSATIKDLTEQIEFLQVWKIYLLYVIISSYLLHFTTVRDGIFFPMIFSKKVFFHLLSIHVYENGSKIYPQPWWNAIDLSLSYKKVNGNRRSSLTYTLLWFYTRRVNWMLWNIYLSHRMLAHTIDQWQPIWIKSSSTKMEWSILQHHRT